MKITYPISDNLGNDYLVRIEDFQNLPDDIIRELGNIKILDITLERVSGEGHTDLNVLSKISIFIAGVLLDNENAILYFYCDDVHEIKRRNMDISPQKYRNDLFSAMFQRCIKINLLPRYSRHYNNGACRQRYIHASNSERMSYGASKLHTCNY
ncbi:hypothetical protein [Odoribacter lunatus]|uniref:hypothetical protein n=1 Tax=Odoribacter lunatus TaxID=2941335 RepID=UPI00203E4A6F|nr:hypothetical protein [Odoribacter lunatus]